MKLLNVLFVVLVLVCTFGAARAESLSAHQKAFIDRYLAENDLNIYGDPEGTFYMGGNPLFDESTGQSIDRYQYVIRNHPHVLESFVEAIPVNTVLVSLGVAAAGRLSNDFDARRVAGRTLSTTVLRETEEAITALVESMAVAIESRDYRAIATLFSRIDQLSNADLKPFATVFKQARQMLQMPSIQPIEFTAEINALLVTLDKLEARLR